MDKDELRIDSVFHAALEISAAEERDAYLDQACGSDGKFRERVERLLAAQPKVDGFLEAPAVAGAALVAQPALAERPGTVIGQYQLVEQIGEGGFGVVFLAEQTQPLRRRVALKVLKPGMDSRQVVARFEAERRPWHAWTTPTSPASSTAVSPTGQPFFVIDLVNGLALTKFCDEARLTPRERLELFVPICQAVQHAHQKGIVHRDLKPANILVTHIDGRPVPKVIDFGVAKATATADKLTDESFATQLGAMIGTLEYMAPERKLCWRRYRHPPDIYSLGVILYELLTGRLPLDAKRLKQMVLAEMLRILKEEEPSKPSTRLATEESLPALAALRQTEPRRLLALLRGELDWLVMKCLEKQRERRYETANALGRDLRRYLADEPVEAAPEHGLSDGKVLAA